MEKTKIILAVTALTFISVIALATYPRCAITQLPQRVVALCPSLEVNESDVLNDKNKQSGTRNKPIIDWMEERNVTPSNHLITTSTQPTEKEEATNIPIPPTQTATKPTVPAASQSTEPKMGDTRIVDG